jgi:hypothetical protein
MQGVSQADMHLKIEVVAALIDLSKILPECCGRPCGKLQVIAHSEQLRLWDILVRRKRKKEGDGRLKESRGTAI